MDQKQVEFECRYCKTRNTQTVTIDEDNDVPGLNMRHRTVDVTCDNPKCRKVNTVNVYA